MEDISQALASCERALRQLMVFVYRRDLGPDWFKAVVSNKELRAKCRQMMAEERSKRPGQGRSPSLQTELDFTTLGELIDEVAAKRWAPLKDALGPAENMLPLLRRLKTIRDPNAHSREPRPYEVQLAFGITGEVVARVTTYMSTEAPSGEYYPLIGMLRDSFGNEIDVSQMSSVGTHPGVETGLRLQPGDEVLFDCRGTDPQGRALIWKLLGNRGQVLDTQTGDTVQLRWAVSGADVAAHCMMKVFMLSGGDYHRFPDWDCRADLFYEVLPPSA